VSIESLYNEIENQIANLSYVIKMQAGEGRITSEQSALVLEQLNSTLFAIEQALTTKEGASK
jgi:hypothetical protein